jgi:hypothetical protein
MVQGRPTIRYFHIEPANAPVILPPSMPPSRDSGGALEIAIRLHGGSAARRLISQFGDFAPVSGHFPETPFNWPIMMPAQL